jgi:uncharacterized Tic20 family protein
MTSKIENYIVSIISGFYIGVSPIICLIFSLIGLDKSKKGKTGKVLSIIGIVLSVLVFIAAIVVIVLSAAKVFVFIAEMLSTES